MQPGYRLRGGRIKVVTRGWPRNANTYTTIIKTSAVNHIFYRLVNLNARHTMKD